MGRRIVFYIFILFLLFTTINSGNVKIITDDDLTSKYKDYYYLHSYRIPIKMNNLNTNSIARNSHYLSYLIDEDFDTYWESYMNKHVK